MIFAGGIPIKVSGKIVGAVGASAGTVQQDMAVAEAAAAALGPPTHAAADYLEGNVGRHS